MSTSPLKPLDPFKCAEQAFLWSGSIPLQQFQRVLAECSEPETTHVFAVDIKFNFAAYRAIDKRNVVWFDATIRGAVPQQCQRCLDSVDIDVQLNIHLALLNDEKDIEQLDEDADFIVLGESQATTQGDMFHAAQIDPLLLLEDELLLALPNAPKHEQCEHHAHQHPSIEIQKKENPFDVLIHLKDGLKS